MGLRPASLPDDDPDSPHTSHFLPDDSVLSHFEEWSYTLIPDGSGAFMIWWAEENELTITAAVHSDGSVLHATTTASLVLRNPAFVIGLVAPDDPARSPFSAGVLEHLLIALRDE